MLNYLIQRPLILYELCSPPIIEYGKTSLLTTAPAAIIAPFPTFTPINIVTSEAIQTSSLITTSPSYPIPFSESFIELK